MAGKLVKDHYCFVNHHLSHSQTLPGNKITHSVIARASAIDNSNHEVSFSIFFLATIVLQFFFVLNINDIV